MNDVVGVYNIRDLLHIVRKPHGVKFIEYRLTIKICIPSVDAAAKSAAKTREGYLNIDSMILC